MFRCSSILQCRSKSDAVGRDDLDRSRKILRGGPVQESSLGQTDVREKIAVSLGLGSEDPAEVRARHEPGDGSVATEVVILNLDDPDVIPTERVDERTKD
jgi:hypothetical protein